MEGKLVDDKNVKDSLMDYSQTEIENYFKSIDHSTRKIHTDRISTVFHLLNETS